MKRLIMTDELPKSETKAREVLESFALELAKNLKEKKAIQLTLEVNLNQQGGISRSWFRTKTEIK